MSWIYDLGFFIFGILSFPHFLARLRQAEDPQRLVRERLGFFPRDGSRREPSLSLDKRPVWIHAVSVGEVLAMECFLQLLREKEPELSLLLTTVTPTGQQVAKKWESERLKVAYFPFDLGFSVRRFFRAFRPKILLLVETEIWPNVIREAARRGIPIGIINGRLSERSFRGFRRFSGIFRPLLQKVDFFLVQTEKDEERLKSLGVEPEKVSVTGNMKLDAFDVNGLQATDWEALRKAWGFLPSDLVLIGGSTHAGEETVLLKALEQLREEKLPVKLLLAPRHIERSEKILEEVRRRGFQAVLASRRGAPACRSGRVAAPELGGETPPLRPGFDVLILDELGVLKNLYVIADAVFMGGSLVRHGGQNPVEPGFARRAILHGPWVFNFEDLYRRLDEEGGSIRVHGERELLLALKRILPSEREKEHLGRRAYEVLEKLRGATERNWNRIRPRILQIGALR